MLKNLATQFLRLKKDAKSNLPVPVKGGSKDTPPIDSAIKNLGNVPVPIVDGVKEVLNGITEYLKIAEVEQTKRVDIVARRDVALQQLHNQRAAFEQLMRFTFQERAVVLQKQLDTLDFAMANGNVEVIKAALDGMVSVIQTSPFKNVQEMQAALGSKDFVVRLE
ncbi:hypothetical protein [Rhodocyclus tenuis]|uniref:hypothetical protein n=1 Tax=Rhodocyclus tenuis TaxID=1066 RepID=UPI001902EB40|nr:hypothetical protein [Rhodocyclus tenuis]MBK1679437.1 hypothetical protein [Rhodocyclus tenuis]